ncbi:hypothetical protein [Halodesulfovibrio spirochaetisodalis]|uniref:Uncharacterized protein n=1 Tax=Halodesulfovibrio spirochaetisodalis TaxID=1560234 RepID=A0A1B7XCA0_9BACT|nr:hypothetical protein [Halodesulfovibrio spirochaetisodalis]OBQ51576.1 hypothetical protein SP90_09340 [Halodesulfovibrio spirochaetisodalis]
MTQLTITIDNTDTARTTWRYLTQSASEISADIGSSMMDFLTKRLGFPEEYIDSQIKTIFINGKPVDDLYSATIPENARIALGAVAPGVAGMTMCRNSPISALRGAITYENADQPQNIKEGTVTLLLFNAVMEDKGLELLSKGLTVQATKIEHALSDAPESVLTAVLDKTSLSTQKLIEWIQKNPQLKVQLRVKASSE